MAATIVTETGLNKVQLALKKKTHLFTERAPWFDHWRELSKYQTPRLGKFFIDDTNKNKGSQINAIYDEEAAFALNTLRSGLMSGMTSPARPWFRSTLSNKDLAEREGVKTWLYKVDTKLRAIFSASNTYRALGVVYEELGLIGTASCFALPDFENVVHLHNMTGGEFAIATNHKGEVDTVIREMQMTTDQMVRQFGLANCSFQVQQKYKQGDLYHYNDVVHIVAPRAVRDTSKLDAQNMRYESCYFEPSRSGEGVFLRESGFKRCVALTPRWDVKSNDVYGYSPGMQCLGSAKQLQHEQLKKGQAIAYQVEPPLQVPTALKDKRNSFLPGGIVYYDTLGPSQGVRSAYEVNLNMQHLLDDIRDVRERIRRAYYVDLFLMLANDTRSNVTATEIAQRHEEKLLMLGPVLERLQNELLAPLIDLTFEYAQEAGILPPPPPELEGMQIELEFTSVLAQAQRAVAAGGVDRLFTTALQLSQAKPETLDKLDFDQAVDDYADMYGVNPQLVLSDDKVAQIRAQRAQAAQAAQSAAVAPQLVESAKTASEVDGANLSEIMQMFSGYTSQAAQDV